MNNERVTLEELHHDLVAPVTESTLSHVLILQDTSQYNFDTFEGRFAEDDEHIGVLGGNTNLGVFAHPGLALDTATGLPIGFTDLNLYNYNRQGQPAKNRNYQKLPIEDKRSYRWLQTVQRSAANLPLVQQITVVADREADIYQFLTAPNDDRIELLVRIAHDRRLTNGLALKAHLSSFPWQGEYQVEVKHDRKRKEQSATLSIRYDKVELVKPKSVVDKQGQYPLTQKINVVEVRELHPPEGLEPIVWYLYTTHSVDSLAEAIQVVKWYASRWWIEDFFRITKKQGFELEKSQLRSGLALKRLMFLVFEEALKVLLLRQGRQAVEVKACDHFKPLEIRLLKHLQTEVEGQSSYQRNPFAIDSLAWAGWIIARLGSWTARSMDKRPPGVITYLRGYRRFKDLLRGFELADKLRI